MWNHRRTGGEALARQFENRSAVFRVFADVADCVAEADVIVCATFATEPVLEAVPMKPWVHINGRISLQTALNSENLAAP